MVKTVEKYVCDICGKAHKALSKAEDCEKQCRHDLIEIEKKDIIIEKLGDIRNTSSSLPEVADRATEYGKEIFDDPDFYVKFSGMSYSHWTTPRSTHIVQLPHIPLGETHTGAIVGNVEIVYALRNRIANGFSSGLNSKELNRDLFLRALGIFTGSGSGNGKVFTYAFSSYIPHFPVMEKLMMEIKVVIDLTDDKTHERMICYQLEFNNNADAMDLLNKKSFINAEIARLYQAVADTNRALADIAVSYNTRMETEYRMMTKDAAAEVDKVKWLKGADCLVGELAGWHKITF
jgi:hypothetical protein